jgi:hypothetical protein
MALYIQESYINASENYRCGESEVYETRFDKPGELYRFLVREFGRCISKMYVE